MFKSFWNGLGYRHLRRVINSFFNVDYLSRNHTSLQLFIRLVNNIINPCIVVAVINEDCFYNLMIAPPPVNAQFTFQYCSSLNIATNVCSEIGYATQSTSFNPPYIYSFQCSSRFIT